MSATSQSIPFSALVRSPVNVSRNSKIDSGFLERLRRTIEVVGLLQPLIVRPVGEKYEVIAGDKRYRAIHLYDSSPIVDPVPCIVHELNDVDAESVSLIENTHRLPMDPLDEYEAYASLVKNGKTESDIAETFGVEPIQVKRALALSNLVPELRKLYRDQTPEPYAGEVCDPIDSETLKTLTLATKKRQREFIRIFKNEDESAPGRFDLKAWALGDETGLGAADGIPVSRAIFDPGEYKGPYIHDLFSESGEEFADRAEFIRLQRAALEKKKTEYQDAGADFVELIEGYFHFNHWQYDETDDVPGGVVLFLDQATGKVEIAEGLKKRSQYKDQATNTSARPERPELSADRVDYVRVRKLAMVRAAILSRPMLAARVLIANALGSHSGVSVSVDRTPTMDDHGADVDWREASSEIIAAMTSRKRSPAMLADLSAPSSVSMRRLEGLTDDQVLAVLACLVSESLHRDDDLVDTIGRSLDLGPELGRRWDSVEDFLDEVRDREVLSAMLKEVAGPEVAAQYKAKPGKIVRAKILELAGDDWRPSYFNYPSIHYTKRKTALNRR